MGQRILIFGPQGSGKGTQAELIARRHGLPYISTGDIFRYHRQQQTELGKKIEQYISSGQLVPDELTNEMVKERLAQPDCLAGFVLDGYPRTQSQLEFLDTITGIDHAVVINLSDQEAIERLAGRLACVCGLSYHLTFSPPEKPGRCNKCGNKLFRRDDDQPAAIKQRLAIYHRETEPVFAILKKRGRQIDVDGSESIEGVFNQIEDALSHDSQAL